MRNIQPEDEHSFFFLPSFSHGRFSGLKLIPASLMRFIDFTKRNADHLSGIHLRRMKRFVSNYNFEHTDCPVETNIRLSGGELQL